MNWRTAFTKLGMLLGTPLSEKFRSWMRGLKCWGEQLGDGLNCMSLSFLGYQMPLFNTVISEG